MSKLSGSVFCMLGVFTGAALFTTVDAVGVVDLNSVPAGYLGVEGCNAASPLVNCDNLGCNREPALYILDDGCSLPDCDWGDCQGGGACEDYEVTHSPWTCG